MKSSFTSNKSLVREELIKYSEEVFKICLGFVRNPIEAEELTQDVFMSALKNLNTLKRNDRLRYWLLRITRNTCLNYIRKKRLHRLLLLKSLPRMEINTFERNILNKEKHQRLKEAVNHLPHKQRLVFVFREYGHLSYHDISKVLNIREGTVMSRLNRARQAVLNYLKEKNNGE